LKKIKLDTQKNLEKLNEKNIYPGKHYLNMSCEKGKDKTILE